MFFKRATQDKVATATNEADTTPAPANIAAGKHAWAVHFPRMIVLLLFGLAHFYLLWWGDILANYALVGMIAFVFWRLPTRLLLLASAVALSLMYLPMVALGFELMNAEPTEVVEFGDVTISGVENGFLDDEIAAMRAQEIAEDKAAHATPAAHFRATIDGPDALRPFESVPGYGLETLGLMLLGMAGYKSGFLTGSWSRRRYAQVAAVLVGASLLWFGQACWRILEADFARETFQPWGTLFMFPMHPFAAIGYAALAILAFSNGGVLASRLAAVGRAAFTNYLGATLIGTVLFSGFGFGLYGELSRGEAWLFVPALWAAMLLWSKWWLDRFRYGPFEWAWRCLARWTWEPLRRAPARGARPA